MLPFSIVAAVGPPLLYVLATAPQHATPLRERLKMLPLLTITGFGISLSTSIAVLQGLTKKGGAFVRTPKLNLGNRYKQPGRIDHQYIAPLSPIVWVEIGLGIYALLTGILLKPHLGWGIVVWMSIYTLGYFYIAGLNLIQHTPIKTRNVTDSVVG